MNNYCNLFLTLMPHRLIFCCMFAFAIIRHNLNLADFLFVATAKTELGRTLTYEKSKMSLFHGIPNCRVKSFVGREHILARLNQALSTGRGPCIAVIQAMGGQGKTQVALEYCHRKKIIHFRPCLGPCYNRKLSN